MQHASAAGPKSGVTKPISTNTPSSDAGAGGSSRPHFSMPPFVANVAAVMTTRVERIKVKYWQNRGRKCYARIAEQFGGAVVMTRRIGFWSGSCVFYCNRVPNDIDSCAPRHKSKSSCVVILPQLHTFLLLSYIINCDARALACCMCFMFYSPSSSPESPFHFQGGCRRALCVHLLCAARHISARRLPVLQSAADSGAAVVGPLQGFGGCHSYGECCDVLRRHLCAFCVVWVVFILPHMALRCVTLLKKLLCSFNCRAN